MLHHANEEEGAKVYEKAKLSFNQKNYADAIRLAEKAQRMLSHNSPLIAHLKEIAAKAAKCVSNGTSSFTKENVHTSKKAQTSKTTTSSRENLQYNPDLEKRCKEIIKTHDYYEILGVSNTCSNEDLKKSFRKLALQFHPDKAKCPSAEAAFKVIAKAYQCLSNENSRKLYDIKGYPSDSPSAAYTETYQTMTAQEVFEAFFGPGMGGHFQYHSTCRRQRQSHPNLNVIQFFPIFVIITLWLMSNFIDYYTAVPYSLSKTSSYSQLRTSSIFDTPYYVNNRFDRSYPLNSRKLHQIETQIELTAKSRKCLESLQQSYNQLQALRFYGTASQYRKKYEQLKAKKLSNKDCQQYSMLKKANPYVQFPLPRYGTTSIDPDDII